MLHVPGLLRQWGGSGAKAAVLGLCCCKRRRTSAEVWHRCSNVTTSTAGAACQAAKAGGAAAAAAATRGRVGAVSGGLVGAVARLAVPAGACADTDGGTRPFPCSLDSISFGGS